MAQQYSAPPAMTLDDSKSYSATFKTNHGDIEIELFRSQAPVTVNNFVFLARDGFYNNVMPTLDTTTLYLSRWERELGQARPV